MSTQLPPPKGYEIKTFAEGELVPKGALVLELGMVHGQWAQSTLVGCLPSSGLFYAVPATDGPSEEVPRICKQCDGTGHDNQSICYANGQPTQVSHVCQKCEGTGKWRLAQCRECAARGLEFCTGHTSQQALPRAMTPTSYKIEYTPPWSKGPWSLSPAPFEGAQGVNNAHGQIMFEGSDEDTSLCAVAPEMADCLWYFMSFQIVEMSPHFGAEGNRKDGFELTLEGLNEVKQWNTFQLLTRANALTITPIYEQEN